MGLLQRVILFVLIAATLLLQACVVKLRRDASPYWPGGSGCYTVSGWETVGGHEEYVRRKYCN